MQVYVKNKVIFENPSAELQAYCDSTLVFSNPEHKKLKQMGLPTYRTPREFCLYEKVDNKLVVPYGVGIDLMKAFVNQIESWKSFISPIRPRKKQAFFDLYDYQEKAVSAAVSLKNGVLVAPCGSGKTQMGLAIISRIGGRSLWVTHTQDLLVQSMKRAESLFEVKEGDFGTITEGKVNIGDFITFATVQTLSNIDLVSYRNEWDIIIVDECHKAVGSPTKMMMFYKVLSNLSAEYKIGLTATPYRSDGLQKCMFALLGNIMHEVPKSAVEDKTVPVYVELLNTQYSPDLNEILNGDGTLNYSAFISDISDNSDRNKLIAERIATADGATLVLCERVSQLNALHSLLCESKQGLAITGSTSKAIRTQALKDLNEGKIDVIFASYKLAKEGLDVPNLRNLVLASPQKDKATVIQSCGRVARKFDGKDFGLVIDVIDLNFPMLKGFAKKRQGFYKKLGYVF